MAWQYSKHYTREEARALLPQIREWLGQLARGREQLKLSERQIAELLARGCDLGGELVNGWLRGLAGIKALLNEFQTRQIEIKDLERGLIDFPAFVAGKEVFLCWEKSEADIEFWHDLTAGYAGREPLT
jgi:hypothetical protein